MIRVLVAEDSVTTRELLVAILDADPEITVVGEANHGREAVELVQELRPDLVTMDVRMPRMDGLEATKEIMAIQPTPIVIVSGHVDQGEVSVSMHALRAGALAVLPKPVGPGGNGFEAQSAELLRQVKGLAGVKVVGRRYRTRTERMAAVAATSAQRRPKHRPALIAIATSTGGPQALHALLGGLPHDIDIPILVVQHIAEGFVAGLAEWLGVSGNLHVKVAAGGEAVVPRTVYLAPDDHHMGVTRHGRIELSEGPPIAGFRPSATHLFRSAAEAFGARVTAVILTGMGRDGVDGLRELRDRGAYVIAQNEASSVVWGMPGAAKEAGVTSAVLPLDRIAAHLAEITA